MANPTSIMFVCHSGELEIKASVLASSIRAFAGNSFPIYACIPIAEGGTLSPSECVISFLEYLGVETRTIVNPISSDYPYGNKIGCFENIPIRGKTIFMDSDIMLMQPLDISSSFQADFIAKPVDFRHPFGDNSDIWNLIYGRCECIDTGRRLFTTVGDDLIWPYFNSGVIGVNTNTDFGNEWIRCAHIIDKLESVPHKRPFLDQISLPLAVLRSGLPISVLQENLNFPAHVKSIRNQRPAICHYHWPSVITREPSLAYTLAFVMKKYKHLKDILHLDKKWGDLEMKLADRSSSYFTYVSKKIPPKCAFITGIPRSGTSLLCKLINDQSGHVVINEPSEIFACLNDMRRPWGLTTLYAEWYKKILLGDPIMNKVIDGQLVEDTMVSDDRVPYLPTIDSSCFTLWTKNTVAYLARLASLHAVFPEARIIACIRHPFDTIASWNSSFIHLKTADVSRFPIGGPTDTLLSGDQLKRLAVIRETDSLCLKRALLWKHMASLVLEYRHNLSLVRYEDLILQTQSTLSRILHPHELPAKPEEPANRFLSSRSKREQLSISEKEVIRDICLETAIEFGYDMQA